MENTMLSLKISEDMVKEIVSKQIQQAIVKELGNAEEYMEALVNTALHQKVSSNGSVGNYSSDNKFDYLDLLLKKNVQEAASAAMKEYITENTDKLKAALRLELEKTATKDKLVETFVNGAVDAFACRWNFSCIVSFATPKD
jgi:hypothetical protein